MSAAAVSAMLGTGSPSAPLGGSATSAPMHVSANALLPLVYWYGHTAVPRNPLLLDRLIRNLGEMVFARWENDPEGAASGLIVDTPAAFAVSAIKGKAGKGPDQRAALVKACVDAFRSGWCFYVVDVGADWGSSQCYPRGWAREAQCRNAKDVRRALHCR